ncbi:MAG: glycolate oxidase FAD binding subunit [Paraglaciecola sp.]|jgi:glycolate oxidase FAD binding subunit
MADVSQRLIEQVAQAAHSGSPFAIIGGGSKRNMGRTTALEEINVSEHSGVISYDPSELVITARAGTTIAELEKILAEKEQIIPSDPPHYSGKATLGGALACNTSGPSRPWNGALRDAILGIKLINGKAEQLNFGGQVMKNVAGYDVSRLQAGAMGSFGIITEISMKVVPKPQASLTLVYEFDGTAAINKMIELGRTAKPISAVCWCDNNLYVRLSGTEQAVHGSAKIWGGELLNEPAMFWKNLREQQLEYFSGEQALWRFSIRSSVPLFLSDMPTLIDWGGAQRWLRGDADMRAMEQHANACGGHVSLYRNGDRSGEVMHNLANPLKTIHQRLKASFDPQGIINPGRLYSWL